MAILLLTGCKYTFDTSATPPPIVPAPTPNPLAGCWTPKVKGDLGALLQQQASEAFNETIPADMPSPDMASVKNSFVIKTHEFLTFSYDKDSGSLHCGAMYEYTYTRPDGTIFTHNNGDLITFEVYQGEDGLDASVNGSDTTNMNVKYETAAGATADGDQSP